ncbi:putative Clp protease proteolytic subunit /Translocation-enhancing protein TepA [Helianthus anomalus]
MVNDFRVESVVCIEGVVQNNLLVVLSVIAANFYLLSLSITFRSLLWSSTVFSQSFDEFQVDDIQNVANELLRIRDYLFKELAQKTGQPMEQVYHIIFLLSQNSTIGLD